MLRPVESGYSPGGVRDQFQLEAPAREPFAGDAGDRYQLSPVAVPAAVPAGAAAIRRLPVHNGAQTGQQPGQPSSAGPVRGRPVRGRSVSRRSRRGRPVPLTRISGRAVAVGPGVGRPAHRPGGADGAAGPGLRRQPRARLRWPAPGQRAGLAGRPAVRPGRLRRRRVRRPVRRGPGDGGPGQQGTARPGRPAGARRLSRAEPGSSAASGRAAGRGRITGLSGQSGVSLSDAVQSAHEEGQTFGESVARDAPALWLEAVLARKPRMPSDLEARLLQGSALPIDFLLHDEVRHALRRGFWDALEHARR